MLSKQILSIVITSLIYAGCADTAAKDASPPPLSKSTIERVDSIASPEESAARFRNGLGPGAAADRLTDGATSRDELIQRFVAALEQADTSALRSLVISPREFIDLYYLDSEYARPPYQLGADIVWIMMSEQSEKGRRRLLQRLAGQSADLNGYSCPDSGIVHGDNRIFNGCTMNRGQDAEGVRLFGGVIERDGRFKFLSYANDM